MQITVTLELNMRGVFFILMLVIIRKVLNIHEDCFKYMKPGDLNNTEYTGYKCLGNTNIQYCNGTNGEIPTSNIEECEDGKFCYAFKDTKAEVCGKAPPACTAKGIFAVPPPNECTHYVQCTPEGSSFKQTLMRCPKDQHFNIIIGGCTTGACVTNVTATCTQKTIRSNKPDPTNCKYYYKCKRINQSQRFRCPGNTFFDETLKICTLNANCGTRPNP